MSCKIHKSILISPSLRYPGYPENIAFADFRRRFDILLEKGDRALEPVPDEKQVSFSSFIERFVELNLNFSWNDNS